MQLQNRETVRKTMDQLGCARIPFFFLLDFKGESGVVVKLSELIETDISCAIKGGNTTENLLCLLLPICR